MKHCDICQPGTERDCNGHGPHAGKPPIDIDALMGYPEHDTDRPCPGEGDIVVVDEDERATCPECDDEWSSLEEGRQAIIPRHEARTRRLTKRQRMTE